ncbi:HAD family hydrolase [Roseospirillum parvum]|uniref:Hydrolase of the HAD superfamily n=1 Tax=Roseospirillum parvum TaxID=83401 RepID=A0A1G7TV73_9PROT|nr:hypothetical protein [Roseospirillum parvum]SDG39108.1 hypothetical protein SAMN05421742_101112 [Roseospirillum parvum]
MLIGLDLDNTLIDYDAAFRTLAVDLGWLPADFAGGKAEVRQTLRAGPGGEAAWMRLQGRVYGAEIGRARLFDGALAVLRAAREAGHRLVIVSHKTPTGHFDPDRVDLRAAARAFLTEHGGLAAGGGPLADDALHFADSRDGKIAQIAALGPAVFVDDLPEVLTHPAFPAATRRLLFQPAPGRAPPPGVAVATSWAEVGAWLGLAEVGR